MCSQEHRHFYLCGFNEVIMNLINSCRIILYQS